MSDYALGEMQRVIANMMRIGVIEELDEQTGQVRVNVSGLVTGWLDVGVASAGRKRQWSPKQVGEQVLLFSPGGDMAQAVVGPSLYQDAHPAPGGSKAADTTVFADGTTIDYNMKTNTYTLTVSGAANVVVNCKVATIVAEASVKIDSPETHITGHVTIDQGLDVTGDATITAGDVKADAISLKLHRTSGVQGGNGTSSVPVP